MNSYDLRDNKSIQNRLVIAFCVIVLLLVALAFVPAVSATQTNLTFTGHSNSVDAVEVINSSLVVSASADDTVKIWYRSNGTVKQTLSGHSASVEDVEELDNGNIITASEDETVKIWYPSNGTVKITFTKHQGTSRISDVEQLDNGLVVSAPQFSFGTYYIWYPSNGTVKNSYSSFVSDNQKAIDVLNDGRIASATTAGTVKIWYPSNGTVDYSHSIRTDDLTSVEQLNDGRLITTSRDQNAVDIFDIDDGIKDVSYTNHNDNTIDVNQFDDGTIITGSGDSTAKVWNTDTGLASASTKIAKPVPITDVKKPSQTVEIYGINNSDLKNGDTIDIDWGDGTVDTVTYNTTSTYTHTYSSGGDYTVKMVADETRSTNVTIHTDPTPSIDLVPSNSVLEGESVEFRANNTTSGTTASRPTTDPLTVTSRLVQYNAFYTENSKDSFYSGSYHNYQNRTAFTPAKSPTDKGVGYWTKENESYQTIPVNLSESWTITSYHNTNPSETSIIWASPSGHGVAVKNSDLIRITPSQNITVNSSVDYNADGHNITVTHDADGSFEYYIDGSYAGSDGSTSAINNDAYVIQGANSISGVTQSDYTVIDDWRIYDTDLTDNQVSNLHDSYTVDVPSGIDYEWTIDSSFLSNQEIYNETSGFNTGSYNVELTAQNADGLTNTASTTLSVSDVVKPRIDNLSPIGDQNTRNVDISADVSHPNIGSNYEINVTLTRLNKITGNVKQLKNVNISSNQTVTYSADHSNTDISNYNVDREEFEYEWKAVEPNQLKTATESGNYSIPVSTISINNVTGSGLQSGRSIDLKASINSSVSEDIDIKLIVYDDRDNTTSTVYTDTVQSNTRVSYTYSIPDEESSIPSDYRENNRFSYQWVADSGQTNISSKTKVFSLTGMMYVIDRNGDIISQQTTVGSDVESNGTHWVSNLTSVTSVESYTADVSSSGYADSSVFIDQFSRSYTAMLYPGGNSSVFNQTFGTPDGEFDFSRLDTDDSYLILSKTINGVKYDVSANSFDTNGQTSATVFDGTTYQLAIYDGENRRSIGSWTANKSDQSEVQVEPRSVDFVPSDNWVWDVNTTYDRNNTTGYIDVSFSSNGDNIRDLNVTVIRQNDSKIVFSERINGNVTTYGTNVSVPDGTYNVSVQAYDTDTDSDIKVSESVTFGVQKIFEGLPPILTTWLASLIVLVVGASLSMVSAPYGLLSVISLSSLFVAIGWLPISMTVVIQAGFISAMYFFSRSDI